MASKKSSVPRASAFEVGSNTGNPLMDFQAISSTFNYAKHIHPNLPTVPIK